MTTGNGMIPVILISADCLPVMSYKQMVDTCREIIRRWPDSKYAFDAKRALADLPEQYHKCTTSLKRNRRQRFLSVKTGTCLMDELFGHKIPDVLDHFSEEAAIVLHSGDCLNAIKNMPRECIQLIITSPPYNIGKSYECSTTLEQYLEAVRPVLLELIRVLSPHGSLCWQVGNYVEEGEVFPLDIFFHSIFKEMGLNLRNRIIWHFNHGLHASQRFSGRYETILWFTKTDDYVFNLDSVRVPPKYPGKRHFKGPKKGLPSCNPKGKNPSDIWEIVVRDWEKELWAIPNVKSNHPEKTIHPCQFPVELVERCVLALTNEQDWVLDPFAGVGSALIAALMHNRRAMGCEKEAEYINIAHERIHQYYLGTLRLRPLGRPIYEPTGEEKVSRIPPEWGSVESQEKLFGW